MLGSAAIEGGSCVRTCAVRCPAKSLLVFLIFPFAGLLFIEHFHCILSRVHVSGLHGSFRLVGQPFAQTFDVDAEAAVSRRHDMLKPSVSAALYTKKESV